MSCVDLLTYLQRKISSQRLNSVVAAAGLAGMSAHGANILVNPSFETGGGQVVAQGWSYFMPPAGAAGSYWVDNAGNRAHTGAYYWKQWGIFWDAARTNVAGIYQDFNSAPGSVYEAGGWFYTLATDQMGPGNVAWAEVSFLGASGNLLALYKSADFSAEVGTSEWFYYGITNVADLSQPMDTGDPSFTTYAVTGAVSQLVAPAGTAKVRYRFAFTQAGTTGGAVQFDDAVLDQISGPLPPIISKLSPVNMIFYAPSNGLTFEVTSPSGTTISNNAIQLVLNGVDVSSNLVITGSSSNKNVAYYGLQSNTVYNASINLADAFGFTATASTYFETTWVGVPPISFIWEAEDFDFEGGQYINNPELCSTNGNPSCYFGKVGVEGVDEHSISSDGDHLYRPEDPMATTGSGDFLRKNLADAGRTDYKVGWFPGGEWVNYTRDWPAGTYWVMGRFANGGGSGSVTFSRVNADTSTTDLGTFSVANGRGWSTYDSVFLRDTNGNIVNVTLGGKETYRATTGGNMDMGMFMLVPAQADLPVVSGLFPLGNRPFETTNAFAFNVASQGGVLSPQNIRLWLNGVDVSTNLQVTGAPSSRNVLYPGLATNAMFNYVLTITNDNGVGIALTNRFDTFDETNIVIQAEEFDFAGGNFIPNSLPEEYLSAPDSIAGIDFQHATTSGERFTYRAVGIPQEITTDYKLRRYSDAGNLDYNLGWFNNGEWANYTRDFPEGRYRVYGRFAGSGGFSVYLDQVVSGRGTTNQVTQRLGRFGHVGRDWQLWDWVPLTDEGLSAPAVISLSGTNTLRLTTTGNANLNYIMLVPVATIQFMAHRQGTNIHLSFPTQMGAPYRVFYKDGLTTGNWTLLTTIIGDGTSRSVTDAIGTGNRYYRVVSP